jgi:F420H(2)-dependent quinone reductase
MSTTDLATRLTAVKDQSTCRITTTGRRTGRPHTVTIWFVADGTTLYLGTLSAKRDWVRNVAKTPAAEFAMDGLRFRGRVVTSTDPAEVQRINGLIAGKYWMAWIGSWFGRGADRVFRVDGLEVVSG